VGVLPFDPKVFRKAGYDEVCRIIREQETPRPTARLHGLGAEATEIASRRRTTTDGLKRQLRGDLDWITLKATEKDSSRRYSSASELAGDIRRHLDEQAVQAGRPNQLYLWRKFVRRHKLGVSLGLLIASSLLAGVVATAWEARVADSGRREAEWQSYVANLNAAELYLQSNDTERARKILLMCPPQLRDWEWKYLFLETDSSIATLQQKRTQPPLLSAPAPTQIIDAFGFDTHRITLVWRTSAYSILSWDTETYRSSAAYEGYGQILAVSPDARKVIAARGIAQGGVAVFDLLSRSVIATLEGQPELVSAAFSSDGNRAVGIAVDRSQPPSLSSPSLIVWNTNSGKVLATARSGCVYGGHPCGFSQAALSPDGTRVFSTDLDGPKLWDGESGRLLFKFEPPEDMLAASTLPPRGRMIDTYYTLAFSPDGQRVAAGAVYGTARIWDVNTGRPIVGIANRPGNVDAIVFSPDSNKLLTATEDRAIRIWDAISGKLTATLLGHDGRVQSMAFLPDRNRILTAQSASAKVWQYGSCCGVNILSGHEMAVKAVAFSPVEPLLASASRDSTIRLWNVSNGQEISTIVGHRGGVDALAFSPDGALLASGSEDQTIRIWDGRTGAAISTLVGHSGVVTSLVFSGDGKRLISGSWDRTIRIWNIPEGTQSKEIQVGDPVNSVAISREGRILSSSGDRYATRPAVKRDTLLFERNAAEQSVTRPVVRIWDALSGRVVMAMAQIPDGVAAISAQYSPDGSRVIAALSNGTAGIWVVTTGKLAATIRTSDTGMWGAAVFDPRGTRIFTSSSSTIQLWDTRSLQMVFELHGLEGYWGFTERRDPRLNDELCLAFSKDGSIMASGSLDTTVRLWKTRSAYLP
jgi:WD40 repeat protein